MLSPHQRSGSSCGVTFVKKEESSGTSQRLVRPRSAGLGCTVLFGEGGGYTAEAQSRQRGSTHLRCRDPCPRACHSYTWPMLWRDYQAHRVLLGGAQTVSGGFSSPGVWWQIRNIQSLSRRAASNLRLEWIFRYGWIFRTLSDMQPDLIIFTPWLSLSLR